jgi:hypothetical protein
LGYGRKEVSALMDGVGFNAYPLRRSNCMRTLGGVTCKVTDRDYPIAQTQEHKSMEGRDLVREGTPLKTAADQIGTSLWQLNTLCEHDPNFTSLYAEARRVGYPVMQENLRNEAHRQAFAGDYRALRDMAIIHLPEYGVLNRSAKVEPDERNLRALLLEKMGDLPKAVLDELVAILEREQEDDAQRQIEAA